MRPCADAPASSGVNPSTASNRPPAAKPGATSPTARSASGLAATQLAQLGLGLGLGPAARGAAAFAPNQRPAILLSSLPRGRLHHRDARARYARAESARAQALSLPTASPLPQ